MRSLLRDRLFRKHYDKLIASKTDVFGSSLVNTVSSVTILAAYKDNPVDDIIPASNYFQKMGIVCYPYLILEKDELESAQDQIHVINKKECQWYGVPKQEILIKWLAHETDLLIISNPNNNLLIKYLCAASNSKLKTCVTYSGKSIGDESIDFCVDVQQSNLLPIYDQCKLIYTNLTKIGMSPPVIG